MTQATPQTQLRPAPSAQWIGVTPLSSETVWLDDARRSLARLALLSKGWDNEGSPAPHQNALESARRIFAEIEAYDELPTPHVGPAQDGGLGIEWRYDSRDLDLDILPDGSIAYLKASKTPSGFDVNQMEDGTIDLRDVREVRRLVRWLMQGV